MSLRSKILAYTAGGGLFWLLVAGIVLVAGTYLYSVNRTIVLVAQRNAVESKISAHQADITNLESEYIAQKSQITMELAQSMGYSDTHKVVYMPMKAVSVLSRADTL